MTAISGSYINNTTTKVMRVGDKLYSPIILPLGTQRQVPAVIAKPHLVMNPVNMALSENTCILQEQQKQQVNLEEACEPFVIEASGRLALVCSPYSPMVDDTSVTLHEPFHSEQPNALCRDPSFHAVLPSSAISRSVAMFDERLFDGFSFNGSFSGATTTQPSDTRGGDDGGGGSLVKLSRQPSDDVPWKSYLSFKEDESSNIKVLQDDQENEFSVVSPPKKIPRPLKRKTNAGNILKKSRKNHGAKQTNILMNWYLQNNGNTPSSHGKHELAKATQLNVVQVSTWFQNRKRRYLDTLNEYQTLSKRHPNLVFNYESYKLFVASEKSCLKKKRK